MKQLFTHAPSTTLGGWHNIKMIYEQNSTMKRQQFDDYDPNEWDEDNRHRQKKRREEKRRRRDTSENHVPDPKPQDHYDDEEE